MAKANKYIAVLFFSLLSTLSAIAANIEKGKSLYEANNCGSCHAMDKKIIGPALAGVSNRHSEEWLIQWIRNNKKLRESGDAAASKLYAEYNNSPMNVYENLSDQDVKDILAYIGSQVPDLLNNNSKSSNLVHDEESQSLTYLTFLVIVFFVLFLILTRVRSRLRKIAPKEGDDLK